MLISSRCVAEAPSRRLAEAPSCSVEAGRWRGLAVSGPSAVVRERGVAEMAADAGYTVGIRSGGGNAAAGYLPGLNGSFRPGQVGKVQAGKGSVVTKSTVQNSNDPHNTIQMARLVPASTGEMGPHPEREPGPA